MAEVHEQFINVMEELVLTEAISRVAAIEVSSDCTLDLGDIAAYALNRLSPLYVTTEEGAAYQRDHAKDNLQNLIAQQVGEAIALCLDQLDIHPERQSIGNSNRNEEFTLLQNSDRTADFKGQHVSYRKTRIEEIVEQALQDGYLTPVMEAEIGRICDTTSEVSIEEYMALDRLMQALPTGEVVVVPRKQFINIMEELVLTEAKSRVVEIEATSDCTLDLGDIAAYALNHLPPLYATTEEGATYQRQRAKDDLHGLIAQQVGEAIAHNLD